MTTSDAILRFVRLRGGVDLMTLFQAGDCSASNVGAAVKSEVRHHHSTLMNNHLVGNRHKVGKGLPLATCPKCDKRKPIHKTGVCVGCFVRAHCGWEMTAKLRKKLHDS